ncbi:MAG: HAMP domain-containing histidine kinase [Proteobacteria bacterium]|nr:HAMP domain-containing histidine kinase [Pseudomonadota bacterium]
MPASWIPRSIRGIAIAVAVGAGLVTALLGLATYGVVHHEIERQIDHRIEVETQALLEQNRAHGFEALVRTVNARDGVAFDIGYLSSIDGGDRSMGYILTDASGRRRAGSLEADIPPSGWSEFLQFRKPDGSQGIAQVMNSAVPGGGRLIVAADRAIVDQMDLTILKLFLLNFGLIMLVVGLVAFGFGRIIQRRLAAIRTSAEAIMADDLTRRMPVESGRGELDLLAIALNAMLDRISRLVENLRHISVGIAHDLRTPVNRLRQRLEEAHRCADPQTQKFLDAATAESDELLELLTGLLAISEVNRDAVRKRFAALDVADVVREMVATYQPSLEDRGIALTADCDGAPVMGEKRLLQRALANLLDNLDVHTPAGTQAHMSVKTDGDNVIIRLTDDGPGIPAADRQRVFEPMARLDHSRSMPGHGLGLSMVAAIVSAHQGIVEIAPSTNGLTVRIQLPRITSRANIDR